MTGPHRADDETPRSNRLAAVNVDIDSLYLYYQIHGLSAEAAGDAVWERGVPRFAALFEEAGVRGTFFVVASDLERWPQARTLTRELADAGHEIGSHSWSHPYDLVRRSPQEIAEELDRAQEIITDVAGRPAVGFRAPGYTLTTELLELLAERDYAYDSSLFPCPPYYLAKASVMGLLKLRGRPSASILDRPSVMWQRRNPHRRSGILEIPITVLPGLRFPLIGTSLVMMGAGGYRLIRPWMRTLSFVNLEFHGIDLCGLEEDGLDPALLRQPDMRVPLEKKRALFRSVLEDLTSGWRVDTLENLAGSLGEEP